jgi:tRNA pseudouridine38-40 synthase
MNHRLIIAYDGTPYRGWQIQGQAPTIQLHLESALATLWQQPIRVHGSGRTDTGVMLAVKSLIFTLPRNSSARSVYATPSTPIFPNHPYWFRRLCPFVIPFRFSARGKEYHYRLLHGGNESPFEVDYAWQLRRPLDIGSMREASRHPPRRT